ISPVLGMMNDRLAQMGIKVRIIKAEFLTGLSDNPSGNPSGKTIIADDRDKQLPSQWVPNDARRKADGRNITYLVDAKDALPNGLRKDVAEAAIDRAMATWNSVTCASLPIVKRLDTGADPDLIDGLLGFGKIGTPFLADIVHAGWMPPAFFDLFLPGG